MPDFERLLREMEIALAGDKAELVRERHKKEDQRRWKIVFGSRDCYLW